MGFPPDEEPAVAGGGTGSQPPGVPQVNLPERAVARLMRAIPNPGNHPMRRWIFFLYGAFSHLLFLATFALLAAFVGNLWLPKTIDSPPDGGFWAVAVNL